MCTGVRYFVILSILLLVLSSCFNNNYIESVKSLQIPFKSVSSYTYSQLAEKLENTTWAIQDSFDGSLHAITVTFKGDTTLEASNKLHKKISINISHIKIKPSKREGFVQFHINIDIDNVRHIYYKNIALYPRKGFSESCAINYTKTSSPDECVELISVILEDTLKQ